MANDNQNQVLDEQTDAVDEKSTKRVRKTKPKASESGSTASLFGIAPYQPKKNEEYMSEGQLEHFRQILLAWKEELMSEVDRTLNTMQDENTALPDVNARGGTRYTELLRAHFGVTPQDYRLQRPEYIGGGSTYVNVNPIAQTSATSISGGATPLGNLAAMGTALASGHGFTYHAQEHGYIID